MLLALALLALQAPVRPSLERYAVDPARSAVGFRGSSDLHDFEGRTSAVSGELLLDAADPRTCASGVVRVRARELDTDSRGRNSKMRDLLEADAHDIRFELATASDALAPAGGAVRLRGTFVVRGVAVERDVAATVERRAAGELRVQGESRLAMTDFGIEPPSVLFVDTDDQVEAFWDLVLVPMPAGRVAARSHALSVVSELTTPAGAPIRSESRERFFAAAEGALWEHGETWHLVGREGRASVDVRRVRRLSAPPTAEDLVRELSTERERIVARSGAGAGDAALARIDRLLALVPPAVPAEVVRSDDGVLVRFGGESWLETSGRVGDGDFGACLAGLAGLPAPVREVLAELDGVPARVRVRVATPSGAETLTIDVGAPEPAELGDWTLAPSRFVASGAF